MKGADVLKIMACYLSESDHALLLRCLLADEGALALQFWLELADGRLSLPPGSFIPRLRQREAVLAQVATLLQAGQGAR